jgi:hypothetical protein
MVIALKGCLLSALFREAQVAVQLFSRFELIMISSIVSQPEKHYKTSAVPQTIDSDLRLVVHRHLRLVWDW